METYKKEAYPDGTGCVSIPENWKGTKQSLTFRLNTGYDSLWRLVQLCEVLEYNKVEAKITIPHLIDSQADRRFNQNDSSGLATIARVLNTFKNVSFVIYHPHNPAVVEALLERVEIVDNSEFISQVISNIPNKENLILLSPDAGAFKPLINTCNKIGWEGETYSASKSRCPKTGKLTQFVGREDFDGKDILIVDDLCVYGGTFKGLSKMLKKKNCGRLYLAVSHMTISNLKTYPVTDYFDRVFVTNSKFQKYFFIDDGIHTLTDESLKIVKLFE